jgi:23S rRNA (guanosine2251-2'-O)-methyltransferase
LVVGSEGEGVSKAIKDQADLVVKIPMFGKVESLNVSVAGGIAMFYLSI